MDLSQTRVHWLVGAMIVLCSGCTRFPSPMLVNAGDQPALFLTSEASSAQIGYLSERVPLQITGRARDGRVPVRIDGPLRTRGFVNERVLALRVQRRGRLRGTPIYLAPNDVVFVTGSEGTRVRVHAQARLRGQPFGSAFDGTYPLEGLGAQGVGADAQGPDSGTAYDVPVNTVVPLFESPGGAANGELPALGEAYTVTVVNRSEGWLAVRAGDGPYLIGWTRAPLTQVPAAAEPVAPASEPALATASAPVVSVEAPASPEAPAVAETPAATEAPASAETIAREASTVEAPAEATAIAATVAPLATPLPEPPAPASDALTAVNNVQLPSRLANEPGALKRVAAGTKIVFGEAVIGILKREGYARVVQSYEEAGYADVFVAADDDVAIRGLVRTVDLSDPTTSPSLSETATPVAAR